MGTIDEAKPIARFFLCHRKDAEGVEEVARELQAMVQAQRPDRQIVVVSGVEDFDKSFAGCGSWDAWARDVVLRKDPLTQKPYYAVVVVLGGKGTAVGAATARTLSVAFSESRPVYGYVPQNGTEGSGQLVPLQGISRTGASFKDGWTVR
jgi:hypothetical protein